MRRVLRRFIQRRGRRYKRITKRRWKGKLGKERARVLAYMKHLKEAFKRLDFYKIKKYVSILTTNYKDFIVYQEMAAPDYLLRWLGKVENIIKKIDSRNSHFEVATPRDYIFLIYLLSREDFTGLNVNFIIKLDEEIMYIDKKGKGKESRYYTIATHYISKRDKEKFLNAFIRAYNKWVDHCNLFSSTSLYDFLVEFYNYLSAEGYRTKDFLVDQLNYTIEIISEHTALDEDFLKRQKGFIKNIYRGVL